MKTRMVLLKVGSNLIYQGKCIGICGTEVSFLSLGRSPQMFTLIVIILKVILI